MNLVLLHIDKLAQPLRSDFCSCTGLDQESKTDARRVYKQLWRSVMNSRKTGGPLSIRTSSSTASSPTISTLDAEDEDTKMTMSDYSASRPLTVSIPKNIQSPGNRRPNLSDILANTAPPPWTLTSFMAFLSQNHCLENLEFTMDASRYRKHYQKMMSRHANTPISPRSDQCAYVLDLWKRLIDAYIRESGPREVSHCPYLVFHIASHACLFLAQSHVPASSIHMLI
jgi:hypothetical protein